MRIVHQGPRSRPGRAGDPPALIVTPRWSLAVDSGPSDGADGTSSPEAPAHHPVSNSPLVANPRRTNLR
jgi:hypothetical protein